MLNLLSFLQSIDCVKIHKDFLDNSRCIMVLLGKLKETGFCKVPDFVNH